VGRCGPGLRRSAALIVLGAFLLSCGAAGRGPSSSDDPFDDPFFREGFGGRSLDEIWDEPAPSVGWLAGDAGGRRGEERLLAEHADPIWGEGEDPLAEEEAELHGKSFGQKASEAAVATMSVLFAAGMTALPFLVGAY